MKERYGIHRMRVALGFALALFILLLTSSINLCHTCHLHSLDSTSPAKAWAAPSVADTPAIPESETDWPCLACMFLNAINAAQISLFFFLFAVGRILCHRHQTPGERIIPAYIGTAFQTRAPPVFMACN
ncbi:MAG: hypothetical protein AB9873_05585 [Syntrophobacteraceae bacterium]